MKGIFSFVYRLMQQIFQAEASREARAKVIAAEGEQKASRALREASEIIGDSPAALQLRYLQVDSLFLLHYTLNNSLFLITLRP